jgi:hypothetical protein
MALYFHNNRGSTLYSAWGMWYPNDCPDRGYVVKGWFIFGAGESGIVSTDDMRGGGFLTYGIWEDGYEWSGEVPEVLPNTPFEHCIGSTVQLHGRSVKFKHTLRYDGTHHVSFS